MEWNHESTLSVIEHYKQKPILWDTRHPQYYHKWKKNDAWQKLAEEMDITQDECKRKMTSLLASLRREKGKVLKSRRATKGHYKAVYSSNWFAFKPLQFLMNRNKRRSTVEALEPITEIESESETDTKESVARATCTNKPAVSENESRPSRPSKAKTSVQSSEEMLAPAKENESNVRFNLDECESFGLFLTNKLKTYSSRAKNTVQHHISNILYRADQGQYDVFCHTIDSYHSEAPEQELNGLGSDGCNM